MANSPDLQMHDLICERDQLLRDVASRNSMLDRLNASNERLTAENEAIKLRLQRMCEPMTDAEWNAVWPRGMGVQYAPKWFNTIIAVRTAKE